MTKGEPKSRTLFTACYWWGRSCSRWSNGTAVCKNTLDPVAFSQECMLLIEPDDDWFDEDGKDPLTSEKP